MQDKSSKRKSATPVTGRASGKSVARQDEGNARKDLVLSEILDRAADLFVRRGYANTRIQDIADELGMGRSSLYHYFRSKDEVLIALAEQVATTGVQRLEVLVKDSSLTASARLRAAVLGNIRAKLDGGPRFRMLDRIESELPKELLTSFTRARRRVLDLTVQIIDEGIKSGEFRPMDSKIAAFAVIGMANWTAWWYSPNGGKRPEEIADAMVDMVLYGLVHEPLERGRPRSVIAAVRQLREGLLHLERLAR